jgi:hypothetical protein
MSLSQPVVELPLDFVLFVRNVCREQALYADGETFERLRKCSAGLTEAVKISCGEDAAK